MRTSPKILALCLAAVCSVSSVAAPVLGTVNHAHGVVSQQNTNAWLEFDTQAFEHNNATLQ